MGRSVVGPGLLAAMLSACTTLVPAGTPHDATAVFRPASMVADRDSAAPGDIVALSFPDEMTRGVHFVLEEEFDDSWVHRYDLTSDGPGPGWELEWYVAGRQDIGFPAIGVNGPGPDHVPIPEVAGSGSWRICTGNAVENVCVRLEISGR